jgi:hypothetical protein
MTTVVRPGPRLSSAAILVVLALLVVAGFVAGVATRTITAPGFRGGVEQVGFAGGAFYARVEPDYGIGERWLASTDGGHSWSRAVWVPPLVSADGTGSETWTACADDGVCYRARMDYPTGYPKVGSGHLVERRIDGSDWVREADLDTAPAFIGMAINPTDSSQAVVISWGYGFARDASGRWQELDLAELGSDPPWIRTGIAWIDSRLMTLVLTVGLSILGWLLLPSLQAKWVLQLSILVIGGALMLFSTLFLGRGVFWPNLIWAAVTAATVLGVSHRAEPGGGRRRVPR